MAPMKDIPLKELTSFHPYHVSQLIESVSFGKKSYVAIMTDDSTAMTFTTKLNPTQAGALQGIMRLDGEGILMIVGTSTFTNKEGTSFESIVVSGLTREQLDRLVDEE